jgi:hypothetical protein
VILSNSFDGIRRRHVEAIAVPRLCKYESRPRGIGLNLFPRLIHKRAVILPDPGDRAIYLRVGSAESRQFALNVAGLIQQAR